MRTFGVGLLALIVVGASIAPAAAQDVEALRKEIEQLRKQQEQYQKAIDTLSERLRRIESQPAPTVVQPPPGPSVAQPAPSNPQSQMAPPSIGEVLRPRQPFGLYQQRGAGQLLFDMGIAGDFIAAFAPHNVEKAGAGTFGDRTNRVFPREVELGLFGQVDPFARAEVRIETGEEARETQVSLAEAHVTLLALPYGFQAKFGQMRNRFGLTNAPHEHDLPFVDRPNVLRNFLGDEGLTEKGVEVTWVPDFLPFYVELLGGAFNGDNETAFGRGRIREPLVTGRLRTFFELGELNALQLGASAARGQTAERLRSTILGFDAKYKFRPEGWLHPLLTLSGEAIFASRRSIVSRTVDTPVTTTTTTTTTVPDVPTVDLVDTDGDGIPDATVVTPTFVDVTTTATTTDILSETLFHKRTRENWGWYVHTELQPFRRWAFGARYDWSQFPISSGHEWAIGPYVSFFPSEFLRFRLTAKHTERNQRSIFNLNDATAKSANEIFFQGTFILGAHPAHPF